MENALIAIVCIALLLVGGAVLVQTTLSSVDMVYTSWKEMETLNSEILGTEISLDATSVVPDNTSIQAYIINDGTQSFNNYEDNFGNWDIFIHYEDSGGTQQIVEAVYNDVYPPGDSEWATIGIYLDTSDTPETYESDIFNPGEYMKIEITLETAIGAGADFVITAATPNGISVSERFTAPESWS